MPATDHQSLIESFSSQRILVVGDVMLDWFIWGNVSRISPEAPVPVVEVDRESHYPGGAANVARNITPFGARTDLIGLIGKDERGEMLRQTLSDNAIGTEHLIETDEFPTITKTRVVARHQQVVRIDRERKRLPGPEAMDRIRAEIAKLAPDLDGIIVEDYGKGLITGELAALLSETANDAGLMIAIDPNPTNPIAWSQVSTVKPNRSEAFHEAGVSDPRDGADPTGDPALREVGERLLDKWQCGEVLITLGEHGMMLFSASDDPFHIPTRAQDVFDVSGAGDTAIAIYTLARCAGADSRTAAVLSNEASGIVVGKFGTAPVEKDELLNALQKD